MTGFNPLKTLGIICLAAFLLAAPGHLSAQENLDDFGALDELSTPAAGGDAPAAGGDAAVSENTITETPEAVGGDGMTAESPTPAAGGGEAGKMSEQEQVDALIGKYTFATENPKKDPFRPIVEKKKITVPQKSEKPQQLSLF